MRHGRKKEPSATDHYSQRGGRGSESFLVHQIQNNHQIRNNLANLSEYDYVASEIAKYREGCPHAATSIWNGINGLGEIQLIMQRNNWVQFTQSSASSQGSASRCKNRAVHLRLGCVKVR